MFFSVFEGILELLLHKRQFPALVIQIFVELELGLPSDTCTWTGSSGFPSLVQK